MRSLRSKRSFASSTVHPRAAAVPPRNSVEQVAAKVLSSVVTLQIGDVDGPSGLRRRPDAGGLIVTNYHVVASAGPADGR